MRVLAVVHQVDAGSGVFGEVARRRAELVEWMPVQGPPPDGAFDAVMVFGGGMHPHQEAEHPWLRGEKDLIRRWLDAGTPLLATCLGSELLAEAAGSAAQKLPEPQIGWHETALSEAAAGDPILGGLPETFVGFQWHSYATRLPDDAAELARGSEGDGLDAFRLGHAWGLQFHAEVTAGIVGGWLDRYREDGDAVRAGIDPEPIREETRERIERWNSIGERIAGAFLDHAARLRA